LQLTFFFFFFITFFFQHMSTPSLERFVERHRGALACAITQRPWRDVSTLSDPDADAYRGAALVAAAALDALAQLEIPARDDPSSTSCHAGRLFLTARARQTDHLATLLAQTDLAMIRDALMVACKLGHTASVRVLLARTSVAPTVEMLAKAARQGHTAVVAQLVAVGTASDPSGRGAWARR
jgi:hypothetical protein